MATTAHESMRVTAVMPLYNGRLTCADSLRTMLAQTRPPAEVIVVDDGSTDGSLDVARAEVGAGPGDGEARHGDVRIRFISQPNAGQSAARNAAVALADTELVAFLDQDDRWAPTHLEALVAPFAGNELLAWTFSDFDEIDSDGLLVTERFIDYRQIKHPRRSLEEVLGADLMVLPSASVLRVAAYRAVGGFDEELCGYEDDDLFLRLFRAGWRSAYVPEGLTSFRVHNTSASASPRFQQSRVRFLDKVIASVPDNPRMNRFVARELVFPRLLRTTMAEYGTALRTNDIAAAASLARTAAAIVGRFPPVPRHRQWLLTLMADPERMRPLYVAYGRLPGALRNGAKRVLRAYGR